MPVSSQQQAEFDNNETQQANNWEELQGQTPQANPRQDASQTQPLTKRKKNPKPSWWRLSKEPEDISAQDWC